MSHVPASVAHVRPLSPGDRRAVAAFLDADPGYALFLRANLAHMGRVPNLARYWGAFAGSRVTAVAMDVSGRVALYAPPGTDVGPVVELVAPRLRFTMGRPDLVDTLIQTCAPGATIRREEHALAALEPNVAGPLWVAPPAGSIVRRATLLDVASLTELYVGSAGFEDADRNAVRQTVSGRVRSLRTFLVETGGQVVAAASSTGETPHAAMVGGVWTAPHARNRGYASAVVAALSRDLMDAGLRPYLFYLTDNAPAASVYARIGYRTVGPWSVASIVLETEPAPEGPGRDAHV